MSAPLPLLGKLFCLLLACTALNAGRPAVLVNGTGATWLLVLTGGKPKEGRVVFARVDPASGQELESAGLELDDWFSVGIPLAPGGCLHITCEESKVVNLSVPMALVGQGARSRESYPFLYQENSVRGDALLVPSGQAQGRQESACWTELERGRLRLDSAEGGVGRAVADPAPAPPAVETKGERSGLCAIL